MAYAKVIFENAGTGKVREAPVGFSWTVALFGPFPAFFRSDWKWGIIMLILFLVSGGLSALVFMFIYNKLYIKELIGAGFKARSVSVGTLEEASAKLDLSLPRA